MVMSEAREEKRPWDQLEGENSLWFGRFTAYRLMGPGRGVLTCLNLERLKEGKEKATQTPGAWTKASTEWNWRQRAEAYDATLTKKIEAVHEDEVAEWIKHKRAALRLMYGKLVQRLQQLTPDEIGGDNLPYALMAVTKELDRTYGVEPAKKGKPGEVGSVEDPETTEELAAFRRAQALALKPFEDRAAKATGTDGRAATAPSPTKPAASAQKKQPENGQPQSKEIKLFPR